MKHLLLFSVALLLLACSQPEKKTSAPAAPPATDSGMSNGLPTSIENYYRTEGDSMILPAFSIEVKLTAEAEEKLKAARETVIVSAMISGIPKDTTEPQYAKWGEYYVADQQIELSDSRRATFNHITLPRARYDSLAGKDVQVLINIFSGRHSTDDNILDCDILQEPISKVRVQQNVLTGKLLKL